MREFAIIVGMDKTTAWRLGLLTIGTLLLLAFIVIAGIWVFNNRDRFGGPALAPNTSDTKGTTKGTKAKSIDDTGVFPVTTVEYWVKEADAILSSNEGELTWSVYVVKESPQMRRNKEVVPAAGATVTVQLRGQDNVTLTEAVGSDGRVSWTRPTPPGPTGLYILDITGQLPWAADDQVVWKDREVASYKP